MHGLVATHRHTLSAECQRAIEDEHGLMELIRQALKGASGGEANAADKTAADTENDDDDKPDGETVKKKTV